jgi:HWE histidine kinase
LGALLIGANARLRVNDDYLDYVKLVASQCAASIAALQAGERDKLAAATNELLVEELKHRARKLLTIVGAISERSLKASPSLDAYAESFFDRLQALSRVQRLLAGGDRSVVSAFAGQSSANASAGIARAAYQRHKARRHRRSARRAVDSLVNATWPARDPTPGMVREVQCAAIAAASQTCRLWTTDAGDNPAGAIGRPNGLSAAGGRHSLDHRFAVRQGLTAVTSVLSAD